MTAHAVRHLALLATTDPQVIASLAGSPSLRQALAALPGLPASQLTLAAHADGARPVGSPATS